MSLLTTIKIVYNVKIALATHSIFVGSIGYISEALWMGCFLLFSSFVYSWSVSFLKTDYNGIRGEKIPFSIEIDSNNLTEDYKVEIFAEKWYLSSSLNEIVYITSGGWENMTYIRFEGPGVELNLAFAHLSYISNYSTKDKIYCRTTNMVSLTTEEINVSITVTDPLPETVPLWKQYIVYVVVFFCYCCSALFSGVNLSLLSIDSNTISFLEASEDPLDQKMGAAFKSIHSDENWLICTILAGNVLVNSASSILLSTEGSALIAVIISTFTISIFCEIMPQAILYRFRIKGSYYTLWYTKAAKFILAPIAWPLSRLIGLIISQDGFTVMSQKEMIGFLELSGQLDSERKIVYGALSLSNFKVKDHYSKTPYVLTPNDFLDGDTYSRLISSGFSRIPVMNMEGHPNWIVPTRLLSLIPSANNYNICDVAPLISLDFIMVSEDTDMITAMNQFRSRDVSFGFVTAYMENQQDLDAIPTIVGVITEEDITETIVGQEIYDETDLRNDLKEVKDIKKFLSKEDVSIGKLAFRVSNGSALSSKNIVLTGQVKITFDKEQGLYALVNSPIVIPDHFSAVVSSKTAYIVSDKA